jgi:3-deoxy-D-arabino-heptulosonate 7-phosphate (DAHP) synthase class II
MAFFGTCILALNMFLQAGTVPSFEGDILNSEEKSQLEKANTVDRRIKVYTDASKRIQKRIREAVAKGQFQSVSGDLKLWTTLLVKSLEDIETNLEPKKQVVGGSGGL